MEIPESPNPQPADTSRLSTLPNLSENRSRIDVDPNVASSIFVSRILTNDLLYDNVLLSADPCTLVRLARTCSMGYMAVNSHITRHFNINTHLARYFSDPLGFRSLQAQTGTLVSGSNALQFLDRTFYPDSDLDLYCFKREREAVGTWLIAQGYTFSPNARQNSSFRDAIKQVNTHNSETFYNALKGVLAVYTFLKNIENKNEPLKVQLIAAEASPMEAILYFHSSEFSHYYPP